MPTDFGQTDPSVLLRDFLRNATDWMRRSPRLVGAAVVGVVLIAATSSSYYQINADSVGAVTRFGRFVGTANPGPHFKLPFGIDDVIKVPVERQLKQEFGFRTAQAESRTGLPRDEKTQAESLMLTGDLNVANVEWIVQYKIADPYKYLFKVRDVEETFRLMTEAAMRQVVGDRSVTELLTVGRESIAAEAKELLTDLNKRYDTGIAVQQLVLQDVDPPEPVRPSFNEVNQAIQERERAVNEAWTEYNQEIPRASGRALQKIQAAEGYAVDRVNRAKGEAQRFIALHEEYKKAPEVMRTRLHLETLSAVLPAAGRKVILDESARGILPLLSLDKTLTEVKP
ncbi:MAG: FtsH protease activity modulator HflK [Bacteroidota bacterium]